MKDLKVLNLSIPTLDSSECKTLMGGDGYIWGGELDIDVIIRPDNDQPERPDYDRDDDNQDYNQDDYDNVDEYDGEGKGEYTVPDELKEAFSKLPGMIQNLLKAKDIKISFDKNYVNSNGGPASYIKGQGIITSDANSLLRESIHAVQDILGILDSESHSAEEFQEKALGDLAEYFYSVFREYGGFGITLGDGYESDWGKFVSGCFDEYGNFDREAFKEEIMDFFGDFQELYKNNKGYNDPLENDYDWKWDDFFDLLGL